jgi:hypothetical protein
MNTEMQPYPWQHPTYSTQVFETVVERIMFCKDRAFEANQAGLWGIAEVWREEANKYIPVLLEENERLREEVERLRSELRGIMIAGRQVPTDGTPFHNGCAETALTFSAMAQKALAAAQD